MAQDPYSAEARHLWTQLVVSETPRLQIPSPPHWILGDRKHAGPRPASPGRSLQQPPGSTTLASFTHAQTSNPQGQDSPLLPRDTGQTQAGALSRGQQSFIPTKQPLSGFPRDSDSANVV